MNVDGKCGSVVLELPLGAACKIQDQQRLPEIDGNTCPGLSQGTQKSLKTFELLSLGVF